MTIRETRIFNSKIRKLERLSEQYLNSKIKIEIENKKLKQKLKNTRKALEKAKLVLADLYNHAELDGIQEFDVYEALDEIKQITETKDVK